MSVFERIIEIIIYVVTELKQKRALSDISIQELNDRGYSTEEISTAFSWIADRLEITENLFMNTQLPSDRSFRVFNDSEKELFTKEGWAEIIRLNLLGLLTNENIEQLLDRAVFLGYYKIDDKQLKNYLAQTIFKINTQMPNGSRIMLYGNEDIN